MLETIPVVQLSHSRYTDHDRHAKLTIQEREALIRVGRLSIQRRGVELYRE